MSEAVNVADHTPTTERLLPLNFNHPYRVDMEMMMKFKEVLIFGLGCFGIAFGVVFGAGVAAMAIFSMAQYFGL